MKSQRLLLILCLCSTVFALACTAQVSKSNVTKKKVTDEYVIQEGDKVETATFGGGCFWCTEAVFEEVEGVKSVKSGYAGGEVENPTYKQICTGTTGHAEVIQIVYDPEVVSFEKLVEVHMLTHDPTTLNRQGADVGTQYRSAIFYHSDEQKASAEKIIAKLNESGAYSNPIVTTMEKFTVLYEAEDYHQNFFANNPNQGYCRAVIQPKMAKFRKAFSEILKDN